MARRLSQGSLCHTGYRPLWMDLHRESRAHSGDPHPQGFRRGTGDIFMVTFQRPQMLGPRLLSCGLKGRLCHTVAVITTDTVT